MDCVPRTPSVRNRLSSLAPRREQPHGSGATLRVHDLTHGKKLPVVYDSVVKDTFYKSLDCLAPLGLMVSFGQSSGAVGPVDIGILAAKGSLFLTRPTLNTYTASREDLLTAARELFEVVQSGAVEGPAVMEGDSPGMDGYWYGL